MADNKTHSWSKTVTGNTGTHDQEVHLYSISEINASATSNIPSHSQINSVTFAVAASKDPAGKTSIGRLEINTYDANNKKLDSLASKGSLSFKGTENLSASISSYTSSGSINYSGASYIGVLLSFVVIYKHTFKSTGTVTWNYNEPRAIVSVSGGSGGGTYAYESSIKLTANSKAGHTHSGWFCSNGKTYTVKQLTDGLAVKDLITAYETNLTFTPTYTVNKYTVTWKNADGTTLETDTGVAYGTTPTYNGSTPTKAYDSSYHYTFKSWDKTVGAITGNTTYTATFNSVAHSYTSSVTTQPTCTTTGVRKYTCSCGRSYTETIPAKGHTAGAAVVENKIEATCTADGSYDEVVYCSACGVEISRTKKIIPATGHSPSCYPEITSAQLIYQNKQISADNKVPTGEYFRIVVGAIAHH